MSHKSRPPSYNRVLQDTTTEDEGEHLSKISVVFVSYSTLPALLTSSLPLLVAAASLADPQRHPIRLVPLSGKSESCLAQALQLPRAGIIGLEDGVVGAAPLVNLIHEHVEPIDIPWMREAGDATYLPVEIKATESVACLKVKAEKRKQPRG
jgi:ribonuclease P/MRP protein subunit POP3